MNPTRVVAGVAVLVLAVFWAVVLLELLPAIGVMVVLVAPFVTLLAVGFYGVMNGLGGGGSQGKGGAARAEKRIGALAMAILRLIAQGKTQEEIAASTAVSLEVVGEKLESLRKSGYIRENALSEKGFDAISEQG